MKRGVCAKFFPPRKTKPVLYEEVFSKGNTDGTDVNINKNLYKQ